MARLNQMQLTHMIHKSRFIIVSCPHHTYFSTFEVKNIPICSDFMSRRQRSPLAQCRADTLPLHIVTGRWAGVHSDERVCNIFCNGNVEDEVIFLCLS